jgi:hypothetical protein
LLLLLFKWPFSSSSPSVIIQCQGQKWRRIEELI